MPMPGAVGNVASPDIFLVFQLEDSSLGTSSMVRDG